MAVRPRKPIGDSRVSRLTLRPAAFLSTWLLPSGRRQSQIMTPPRHTQHWHPPQVTIHMPGFFLMQTLLAGLVTLNLFLLLLAAALLTIAVTGLFISAGSRYARP